jgi:hypothetical protein
MTEIEVVEEIEITYFMLSDIFPENHAVYVKTSKNIVQLDRV